MSVRQIRRFIFLLFIALEAIIFLRATPEERKQAPIPPYPTFFGFAVLAPFLLKPTRSLWVERIALALQLLGGSLEVAAMTQLARHHSFGIHPTAATKPLQHGIYRLEHPIYLGILLSLLGWTLPILPCTVATLFTYIGFRRAVRQERAQLASLGIRHRGVDSFLWLNV